MSKPIVLDARRSAAPTTRALNLRPAQVASGAGILPEGALADGCDLIAAGPVRRDSARPATGIDGLLVPACSPL